MFDISPGQGIVVGWMLLWSVGITIYWMVVGWRAMRAHEKLANAVRAWALRSDAGSPPEDRPPYVRVGALSRSIS